MHQQVFYQIKTSNCTIYGRGCKGKKSAVHNDILEEPQAVLNNYLGLPEKTEQNNILNDENIHLRTYDDNNFL